MVKRFIAHAAQATAREQVSTRKVAMCSQLFLRALCSRLGSPRGFRRAFAAVVRYLAGNALRANPPRDVRRGRLSAGLVPCGGCRDGSVGHI